MRLVTAHLICLVLLQASKGPAVVAQPHQSSQMSAQLQEECSVMLRYFEQVTQKQSTDMEDKDKQIRNLKENEIELQRQIKQLEEKLIILQNEKVSYKSREDSMADVLKELKKQQIIIKQLSKNQCDMEKRELKIKNDLIRHLEEREIELQRQNEQLVEKVMILPSSYKSREDSMADVLNELKKQQTIIEQLSKNQCTIEKGELKTKNDQIHHLEEKEFDLQRENKQLVEKVTILQNENTTCTSREVSKAIEIEYLKKQQISNEQLSNNQKEEITSLKEMIRTNAEKLANCESKLEAIDKKKYEEEEKLKVLQKQRSTCMNKRSSGVHRTNLTSGYSFEVLCNSDIAGPGWTVIQQRFKGEGEFYRNWASYRDGFGNFWSGSFFLGLEKIYRLTADQPHELYIHMERLDGTTFYARYDEFAISGEEDDYTLIKLGTFRGPTTDVLRFHKCRKFTTYDRDNDFYDDGNCAKVNHGGWWYDTCGAVNLNGRYYQSDEYHYDSNFWANQKSIAHVKMMIRPKKV